jgi:hypothetical protein
MTDKDLVIEETYLLSWPACCDFLKLVELDKSWSTVSRAHKGKERNQRVNRRYQDLPAIFVWPVKPLLDWVVVLSRCCEWLRSDIHDIDDFQRPIHSRVQIVRLQSVTVLAQDQCRPAESYHGQARVSIRRSQTVRIEHSPETTRQQMNKSASAISNQPKKKIDLLPKPCGMYCQGDSLHIRWSVQIPVTAFGSDPEF